MKKRIFALLLCLAMMMTMLAACSDKTTASGGTEFVPSDKGYEGGEVTIKFAHTMGAKLQAVLDYHIGEFNKIYPNIHIEHSTYGGWGDIAGLINTEIMGDNQPNVAYCYPDHVATYNMSKSTLILDNLIDSTAPVTRADGQEEILGLTQEQKDDFFQSYYGEGKVFGDGKMYTMPLSKSTEVLYYNKTFFDKNGLTVPTTWDEMEAVCRKIKELDPDCIPLGYDSEDNWFITMCEQNKFDFTTASGDEHFLFNNDDCKAFVKRFRGWYQDGLVTTEALYGSYTSGLFTELDTTKAHSYMCIGSTGGASYQIPEGKAFEVGVAPIPQADANNQKVISQGPSLCILNGTPEENVAAWLFVKYLTTNVAFQTEFSSTSGYAPVIKSAQADPTYAEWLNLADGGAYLTAMVVKVGLETAETTFTSPAFVGSSVARSQVGSMMAKCMSESTNDVDGLINKAFQDAYDECVYQAG